MTAPRQLAIPFEQRPALEGEDFLVTPANAEAVAWIDRWPSWAAPCLTVWGPEGCGKTHLARVFLARTGGAILDRADVAQAAAEAPGRVYVIEDMDAAPLEGDDAAALFHLYNAAKEAGGHLLLTARRAPARWEVALADLRSRLNAAPAVEITAPDDDLLAALLVKQFADRQLRVEAEVIAYLAPRMDRTFRAARDIVAAIDAEALAQRRNVTVPLARDVLSRLGSAPDTPGTR